MLSAFLSLELLLWVDGVALCRVLPFEKCPLSFMKGSCSHYLTSPSVFVSYGVNKTCFLLQIWVSPNILEKFGYSKRKHFYSKGSACHVTLHFSSLFVFSMEIGNNGYHSERLQGIPNPMMISIPTYDTMNRFPRASAPPRHIDW